MKGLKNTMKEYITHTRYKGKDINGNDILIRRGQKLERKGDLLYYNNIPICIYRSLIGKQHFAYNDDNLGLERGKYTYTIAYSPRIHYSNDNVRQQRFTDEELETLYRDWKQYIRLDTDVLLFNDKFFEEDPNILKEIAKSVNIDI